MSYNDATTLDLTVSARIRYACAGKALTGALHCELWNGWEEGNRRMSDGNEGCDIHAST